MAKWPVLCAMMCRDLIRVGEEKNDAGVRAAQLRGGRPGRVLPADPMRLRVEDLPHQLARQVRAGASGHRRGGRAALR